MASEKQPKSILKKTDHNFVTNEDRHRDIALQHANIIRQRKKLEVDILQSTETLLDYPLAPGPANAANPSAADAHNFRNLIRYFLQNDYDSLIEERNIMERCGYALCPNQRHSEGKNGGYRLLGTAGKAKDFKIVEKRELERWCSEDCALRAMHVKVQLNEVPVWIDEFDRGGANIDLIIGPIATNSPSVTHNTLKETRDSFEEVQDTRDFTSKASERLWNVKERSSQDDVAIREKQFVKSPLPPQLDHNEGIVTALSHLNLENYLSKLEIKAYKQKENTDM